MMGFHIGFFLKIGPLDGPKFRRLSRAYCIHPPIPGWSIEKSGDRFLRDVPVQLPESDNIALKNMSEVLPDADYLSKILEYFLPTYSYPDSRTLFLLKYPG
jgi:hypothetical protein